MSLISSSYNNESLKLIKQDAMLDWEAYPINISSEEMETIKNFPHIVTILSGKSKSPSNLIGLKEAEIESQTIHLMNDEYNKAIDNYTNLLKKASKIDKDNIKQLENNRLSNFGSSYAIGGGVGGLAGVGAGALSGLWGGPFGVIVGGLIGLYVANNNVNTNIIKKGCAHRFSCFKEIDFSEQARFKRIDFLVRTHSVPLVKELMEKVENNEFDVSRFKKLSQLQRVFEATFPNIPLEVKNYNEPINVKKYLTELNGIYREKFNKSLL